MKYVTQRLDTIYSLMQKHRCKRSVLGSWPGERQVEEAVAATGDIDEKIGELKKRADSAYDEAVKLAGRLSSARRVAVAPLAREIIGLLQKLGIPHARFEAHAFHRGHGVPRAGRS
ncbi:MAG: hypothetical protein U5L72_17970 [Bacteroidales bacterium]|nr:hypothetical protein [Bacteroidales bacterium]